MKVKAVLLMGTFTLLSVVSCTMRSHTEPDIVINNALNLGQAIFVNQSSERPRGIDEIYINEGDTITLKMTTALLKQPAYQWTPDKDGVVKFVQDETDPTVFYAIALADSGAATLAIRLPGLWMFISKSNGPIHCSSARSGSSMDIPIIFQSLSADGLRPKCFASKSAAIWFLSKAPRRIPFYW